MIIKSHVCTCFLELGGQIYCQTYFFPFLFSCSVTSPCIKTTISRQPAVGNHRFVLMPYDPAIIEIVPAAFGCTQMQPYRAVHL